MSQWQPIEMAPKDGTCILLYNDDEMTVASWSDKNVFGKKDWVFGECEGEFNDKQVADNPTHWMPLPAVPGEEMENKMNQEQSNITVGSGNIFKDLGFDNPELEELKAAVELRYHQTLAELKVLHGFKKLISQLEEFFEDVEKKNEPNDE